MTLCLSAFAIVSFGLLTGYLIWAGINKCRAYNDARKKDAV